MYLKDERGIDLFHNKPPDHFNIELAIVGKEEEESQ